MKRGYICRTQTYPYKRQKKLLKDKGCEIYYIDEILDYKKPELNRLFEELEAGDTVIITDTLCLGRKIEDILSFIKAIGKKEAHAIFLVDDIDTSTIGIFTLSDRLLDFPPKAKRQKAFDRNLLSVNNTNSGGAPKVDNEKINYALSLYKKHKINEVCAMAGISIATFYNYKKKYEKQQNENENNRENTE